MDNQKKQNPNFSSCGKTFEKLSFTSLETEALNSLEESIKCHEGTLENGDQFNYKCEKAEPDLEQKSMIKNSSKPSLDCTRASQHQKLNAGYILFDGSDIKYISTEAETRTVSKPPEELRNDGSVRSRTSENSTHISELASHLNLSCDDLLTRDSFKDTISRLSLAPYKRLPTYVHFSTAEKFYLLAIGAVPSLLINAVYISVAFFLPLLGKQVLSEIGICHHLPFLIAMLVVFCGKKHWVPFFPTLPVCFVLMCTCVLVIPAFAVAGVTPSVIAIYAVITLNGFCAGLTQSLVGRVIVLFPGGKSTMLIRYGEGVGKLFPVVLQVILILSTGVNTSESQLSDLKSLCLYVLFGAVFLGMSTGLVSLIKLRRSGIYELFAGRDCVAHSPKNITIGSVPETAKRRYHAIKWCLLAEFTLSLVSYLVLSLAPFIHYATHHTSLHSSTTPFWSVYLATIFLAIFKVGDFLGRVLSRFLCDKLRPGWNVGTFCYLTVSILRLGFVVMAVFYIRTPFLVYHNLLMIGTYFILAFTNGSISVAMTSSCQSLIMVQRKDSCPIVSQFLWTSGVLGANVGIALSFLSHSLFDF